MAHGRWRYGKVKTAIKIFKAVVIGMLIAFLSYAVVYYVVAQFEPNGSTTLLNSNPDQNGNILGGTSSTVIPLKP